MSTEHQCNQTEESIERKTELPRDNILGELSVPEDWEVDEGSTDDSLLLVKHRNQERWQSISLAISRRKNGDKIRARYRKAPYRRGRVGSEPVERETLDHWKAAVDWVQDRIR
jgi:hypothetical protein